MQQTQTSTRRHWKRRALSLLMAAVMVLGLCPAFPGTQASAAHWADPYLSQLVEWGVISTAQAQNPDRALTRADFMGIVNRAYGYHEPGETPFEDVAVTDWYYDDVGIAYNAQYIKGTSPTTASPKDPLTRETATTILGRNMMLQDSAGEILDFTDARRISTWAQGTIKSSLEHYLVSGYDDGTFRPQRNVSWGEMASMVTRLIGTPLQEPGDYSLGGTFGNVTITSPGVTLRDTVVSGDLYITGGVGLGDVKLENVTVLGRIIASGTGSSEGGGASILLRNVTADELLVDNLQGKEVSVRADGITEIGSTTVRTSAYIEDNTPEGLGLHMISLEGESYPEGEEPEDWEPIKLTLAGRIEEVVNRTPGSTVHAAAGTIAKLTVDEAAEGSSVIIDRNTVVKELNLDTATTVTGEGDIDKLVVNAPGCVVEMLPDEIVIRPGITAIINGEEMDSVGAQESSLEPMILAGYPEARDITPTGLDAVFMTNKSGTIYWAVSTITDGSVGEEDLIKPPSYGNIAVSNGSLKVAKGNEETIAKIIGLIPDGSYYLSAVLVDARDQRSAVKVISFTTPDNTVPAFCQGYPYMASTSRTFSQVVVMPNKDCKLYYALLPKGAAAPTEAELKAGAVSGALGYGVQDVFKNVESAFQVNDMTLEEEETYVLYLWLTDANGVNKSKITSLTFTTADETLPYFLQGYPQQTGALQPTNATVTVRVNEEATVYWALVEEGAEYPKPEPGETGTAPLDSLYAKLQVQSGTNALKFGKISVKGDTDGAIKISGLVAEKTYDLYLVIQDKAGNYSLRVEKLTVNTLDDSRPVITQSFSKPSSNPASPMENTGVTLSFSKTVGSTVSIGKDFETLYNETKSSSDPVQAMVNFVTALSDSITFYRIDGTREEVAKAKVDPNDTSKDWVIDYTKAEVTRGTNRELQITFPDEALNLNSGDTYFFRIHDVADTLGNRIFPDPVDFGDRSVENGHSVPKFTIAFAEVWLEEFVLTDMPKDPDKNNVEIEPDAVFRMIPAATHSVSDGRAYDLLLYTDETMAFDLYYRVVNRGGDILTDKSWTNDDGKEFSYAMPNMENKTMDAASGWVKLGNSQLIYASNGKMGVSLHKVFNSCSSNQFPNINTLNDSGDVYYEFAIYTTKKGTLDNRDAWSDNINMDVYVVAGTATALNRLSLRDPRQISEDDLKNFVDAGISSNNGGASIGSPNGADGGKPLPLVLKFPNTQNPNFRNTHPQFSPEDTYVNIDINIEDVEKQCKVYYVIAPIGSITTEVATGKKADGTYYQNADLLEDNKAGYVGPYVPLGGSPSDPNQVESADYKEWVTTPDKQYIWNGKEEYAAYPRVKADSFVYTGGSGVHTQLVEDLEPETDYFAYFVLEGDSKKPSKVYLYTFRTEALIKPKIRPASNGDGTVNVETHVESTGRYQVLAETSATELDWLLSKPFKSYAYSETDPAADKKWTPACYMAEDFTVLDALSTPYVYKETYDQTTEAERENIHFPARGGNYEWYNGGYSIFDIYANSVARAKMYGLITNQRPGFGETVPSEIDWGEAGEMDADKKQDNTWWLDAAIDTKLDEKDDNSYVFLTYAVNINTKVDAYKESEVASFNAIVYRRTTLDLPNFETGTGFITTGGAAQRFSATIAIRFDMNVYKPGTTPPPKFEVGDLRPSDAGLVDGVGSVEVTETTSDSFTIKFTGVKLGSFVTYGRGTFANGVGQTAPEALTISFKEENGKAFVEVTWEPGEDSTTWRSNMIDSSSTSSMDIKLSPGGTSKGTWSGSISGGYTYVLNENVTEVNIKVDEPTGGLYFWESINKNIADVDPATATSQTATIKIKGVGEASIKVTVKTATGEATQTVKIVSSASAAATFTPGSGTVTGSGTINANGTNAYNIVWERETGKNPSGTINLGLPAGMENTVVTWVPTNGKEYVDITPSSTSTLTIRAKGSGTTVITATYGSGTTQKTIKFTITITGSDITVFGGIKKK